MLERLFICYGRDVRKPCMVTKYLNDSVDNICKMKRTSSKVEPVKNVNAIPEC